MYVIPVNVGAGRNFRGDEAVPLGEAARALIETLAGDAPSVRRQPQPLLFGCRVAAVSPDRRTARERPPMAPKSSAGATATGQSPSAQPSRHNLDNEDRGAGGRYWEHASNHSNGQAGERRSCTRTFGAEGLP